MQYTKAMFQEVRWVEWSEDHIASHNITPDEVEEVLFTRPRYVAAGRNDTTLVYGRTAAGRYLFVVAVDEGHDVAFIVTARDMTINEKRLFRQKAW